MRSIHHDLAEIARYLNAIAQYAPERFHNDIHRAARVLRHDGERVLRLETDMGIAANAINKLEAAVTARDATITANAATIIDLTSQLAAANAEPKLDDADQTAIAGVDMFLNPSAPVEAPTTPTA